LSEQQLAFLLDTCSLSELVTESPYPSAVEQLTALPRNEIFLSVMTIGELQQGVAEMAPCRRRTFLKTWLEEHVLPLYAHCTLNIDTPIARQWGILAAQLKERGKKMQVKDSLIAATALAHGLTVVTRNESDFAHCGVRVFNPWR
jgi:toxin FitB